MAEDRYQRLARVTGRLTADDGPYAMDLVEIRGQDLRVYRHAPQTMREQWLASAQFGDAPYIVFGDDRYSYNEAHRTVAQVANWLIAKGVRPGDHVAIAMRNYPEWIMAYWACVSIGAVAVAMNAWWTGDELAYAIEDAAPKVIFVDEERLSRIRTIVGREHAFALVLVRGESDPACHAWPDLLQGSDILPAADIDPDSDANILYTSGTTGFPKGARLTHRGCTGSLWNVMFAVQAQGEAGREEGEIPAPPPGLSALITTPLFHVTAMNVLVYLGTATGGKLVLMYRWDALEALRLIEQEKVTLVNGVPVMVREILTHPDRDKYDLSSLGTLGGSGAPLQPDLVDRIDRELAATRPTTGFGMTEVCGTATSIGGAFLCDKPASVGPVTPLFDLKCVDDKDQEVAPGEQGEVWLRSSTVIAGYLNQPEATAEAIVDGWMRTGDIGKVDEDGFLYILDRKKQMVLRGGENIYCAEVEACIHQHPAVAECCVFGVADERLGEEVGVAIHLTTGMQLSAEELRTHCGARISAFKVPRFIWLMDAALPRVATGKFDRRLLRETLRPAQAL